MKRFFTFFIAMIFMLLPLLSIISTETEAKPDTDNISNIKNKSRSENTNSLYYGFDQMNEFELDEFDKIWLADIIPANWLGKDLNNPITGNEFYDLWLSFTKNTLGIPETELDSNCWNQINGNLAGQQVVERGTAGMLYVFAFLKDQLKLADYDSFDACMENSTARGSLYTSFIAEYLDQNFNDYREQNGGAVWGSELASITKDMTSGAPMLDVDVHGYGRLTDSLTYKEALQFLYRFSRSNRWLETPQGTISFEEAAAAISLTPTQQTMASLMPLPTYENLPDWQGLWMTGSSLPQTKYQYEENYRTYAELGFNHLRYSLFVDNFLNEDHTQFDKQKLNALDDAIGYAIKYGIHISLNIKVSEDNQSDVFVNWANYAYLKAMYQALASRYQQIPSSVLSFYLFFEPAVNDDYAAGAPQSFVTDARYAEICYELADVIWSADDDRFISVDGITFGREPSIALAEEGLRRTSLETTGLGTIMQSFHYFSNGVTWTNGFYGEAPSLTSWPLPYVQNALYAGGQSITINGNSTGFPVGTTVKINQTSNGASPSYLTLNVNNTPEIIGTSVTFTLNQQTNNLVISSSASGNSYNEVDTIWITFPFDAEEPIPIFGFFTDWSSTSTFTNEVGNDFTNFNTNVLPGYLNGKPLESILGTLVRRFETNQIVVINCGGDFLNMEDWGSVSTTVTITEDFGYTSDSEWAFDANYTRTFLEPWLAYQDTYHTETMITEFGANNGSTEAVVTAALDEYLGVLKENDIAWSGHSSVQDFNGSLFNDYIYDSQHQKRRTLWYDVALFDVLQKNMTTFDISPIGRQTYTGKEITPEITVSFAGKTLVEGIDYTVSYFDNLDYGSAVIRVLGTGEYTGMSRTICFTISPFNEYFALPTNEVFIPLVVR